MTQEMEVRARTIVGAPDEVEAAIRAAHERGLIPEVPHDLPWKQVDRNRIAVTVQMRQPALRPATPRPSREQSTSSAIMSALGFVAGLATIATVALAAVAYALYRLLAGGSFNGATILGFLAVVVLVLLGLSRINHSGACSGLHCAGCKG